MYDGNDGAVYDGDDEAVDDGDDGGVMEEERKNEEREGESLVRRER